MGKRPLILKITAALLAAGGLIWLMPHFFEPGYHGKSLSVWLDKALREGDEQAFFATGTQWETSNSLAVRAIGTDGLPTLIGMVKTRDTGLRKGLRELARHYPWIPIDRRDPDDIYEEAAYGFGVLGASAKSAVPDLATLLHDDNPHVREIAAYSLGSIGPAGAQAVPALEKYLDGILQAKSTNGPADRDLEAYFALYALGEMGALARSAFPQIANLTNPPSSSLAWAKVALIKITGTGLDSAMEPLKDTSNYTNWLIAWLVVRELRSNAAPAVPLLLANLRQTNEQIQGRAIEALGRIHARPEQCIPAVAPFLRSKNAWLRASSLEAISLFREGGLKWAPMPEIARCITDSDGAVREAATNALRRVAPGAAAKAGVQQDTP